MIDDIGYDTFFKDCDEVFKDFLAGYGFEDIGGDEEDYEKFYKSKFWILEINMLCNFPRVMPTIDFLNHKSIRTSRSILDKALNISFENVSKHIEEYKLSNSYDTYNKQMLYLRENLEKFYKPILTGEFTYEDYKKFEISEEKQ